MDAVKVDVNSIPDETGRRFGQCIISGLREYLKHPGAREALDARTKARNERRKSSGHESVPAMVH